MPIYPGKMCDMCTLLKYCMWKMWQYAKYAAVTYSHILIKLACPVGASCSCLKYQGVEHWIWNLFVICLIFCSFLDDYLALWCTEVLSLTLLRCRCGEKGLIWVKFRIWTWLMPIHPTTLILSAAARTAYSVASLSNSFSMTIEQRIFSSGREIRTVLMSTTGLLFITPTPILTYIHLAAIQVCCLSAVGFVLIWRLCWYHCLPIRTCLWLWEEGCTAVVWEAACCMEVRPGL